MKKRFLLLGLMFFVVIGVSNALIYENTKLNVTSYSTTPQTGIWMVDNGTRIWTSDEVDKIYQLDCSTAYNISTCSYNNVNMTTAAGGSVDIIWNGDGTKCYGVSYTSDLIYEYDCSNAWDLSSCSYNSVNIATQDGSPSGLTINNNGTRIYEIGYANDKIYQYECGTPYDLSTCSYNNINISNPAGSTIARDVTWGKDGETIYIGDQANIIYRLDCNVAYKLSTCSYNNINTTGQGSIQYGIHYLNNKVYVASYDYGIHQYSLDITPPTIEIKSPINDTEYGVNKLYQIKIFATDDSSLDTYAFVSIGNLANQTITVSGNWYNNSLILTGLSSGRHSIKVYINDSEGNLGLNDSWTLQIVEININTNITNGTYYWLNQTTSFNVTGDLSNYNCWYDVGAGYKFYGSVSNNTAKNLQINYTTLGTHIYNITCGSVFNNTIKRQFTLNDSRIYWTFNASAYETHTDNFTVKIEYNTDLFSHPNWTWLIWNETTQINDSFSSSANITFTWEKTLPLVVSNNTSIDFYAKTNWVYYNGSGINTTYPNQTQALYWAYFNHKTYDDPSLILQYQSFDAYYVINRFVWNSIPTFESYFSFNGTANQTGSVHNTTTFTREFTVGSSVDAVLNWTAYLNITYNGLTVSRNPTTNDSITIVRPNITLCNISSGIEAVRFVFQHETEQTNVTENADLMFTFFYTGGGMNDSLSITNTTNFGICLYPNWTSGTLDLDMEYFNASNLVRWYYFENTTIDNSTNEIILYTLPNISTTQINISVTDANGDDYRDIIVKLQRLFLDEGGYRFVTMVRTDSLGTAIVNIHIPEYYRIILEDKGTVVFDDTIQITETALTIPVVADIVAEWFLWKTGISWNYNYSSTTNTTWFSLNDASGYMSSVNLLVKKLGVLTSTEICNTDYSGTSMTGFCALGDTSGNVYTVVISGVDADGNTFLILADTLDFTTVAIALSHLFIAIIAVGSLAFGFITHSPEAATFASIAGVALLTFANIIHGVEIAVGFAISGILIIVTISRR